MPRLAHMRTVWREVKSRKAMEVGRMGLLYWLKMIRPVAVALGMAPLAFTGSAAAQSSAVAGAAPGALAINAMGQAGYRIPIEVAPGIAGMEPSLSLEYSSGGANGIAGMGWSIGGLSTIHRCPRTQAQDGRGSNVTYGARGPFCLDGKRLVAVSGDYGNSRSSQGAESLPNSPNSLKWKPLQGRSHESLSASLGISREKTVLPQWGGVLHF